jgi:hypothetical protein
MRVSPRKSTDAARSFFETMKAFYTENLGLIVATSLALLSGFFFLVIGYPDIFNSIPSFRQRWFGLCIFGICLLLTYLSCFYSHWKMLKSISVWMQSNVLLFFSFAYYLRLNNSDVGILGQKFDTGLVFIPLVVLIFTVNYNLFTTNKKRLLLVIPQVLLFCLQTFSFIGFLGIDRTTSRDFSQDWLSNVFNLPPLVWLLICAMAIGLVSVLNMKLQSLRKVLAFGLIFFVICFQILIAINTLNTSYWYKSLLFLVCWDFLFTPFAAVVNRVIDPKYKPKLSVSTMYHIGLFLLILMLI